MYTYWWYWRVITKNLLFHGVSLKIWVAHTSFTLWNGKFTWPRLVLSSFFLGVVLLIQHKITETCWEAVPNFSLETTPKFVEWKTPSSFPRSSGGSGEAAEGDSTGVTKSHGFWCVTFLGVHHAGVSDTSQSYFSSLQEASLQTLGVDMCEDMTELEFLHNELAWTLNASCDLRLGFVLDIHNLVLVEGFSQRTQLSNTWAELRSNEISIFLGSRAAWPETNQKAELFFWWTLTS